MNETCIFHDECKDMIKDHEKRIVDLEKADISIFQRIDDLLLRLETFSRRIDSLITTWNRVLFGVAGSALMVLVGFFVWYVQQIGR